MRIFISKNSNELDALASFCKDNNWTLIAESFIEFEKVENTFPENAEIVFFSSPRSVEFCDIPETFWPRLKFAAVGQQTAKTVQNRFNRVDFIGENAGNPIQIAAQFENFVENKLCYFPCSNISAETIFKQLKNSSKIKQVVYKTRFLSKEIKPFNIGVFTSPSNFNAFFENNSITENSIIIAWGNTTKKAIEKHGIKVSSVLQNASEMELIELFKSRLNYD